MKWNYYLITKLEKQKTEKELLLKECVHKEQELEQEYKKSMDENISFSDYHIDRTIKENGKIFDDGAHIIYVNGEIKDDIPLGRLMYDLSSSDPDNMNYKELADRARCFKRDKEGQKIMSRIMEEIVNEEKIEAAKRMLDDGELTIDKIAKYLALPIEIVEKLADSLQLV